MFRMLLVNERCFSIGCWKEAFFYDWIRNRTRSKINFHAIFYASIARNDWSIEGYRNSESHFSSKRLHESEYTQPWCVIDESLYEKWLIDRE